MSAVTLILRCLFQLLLFLLAIKVLGKLKLLPLALYLIGVNTLFPVWVEGHPFAYYGIAVLFLLYPAAFWWMKYQKHRQEEIAAMGELLAGARPLIPGAGTDK